LEVSAVELGCLGFSDGYGPAPGRATAIALIRHAYERGCTPIQHSRGLRGAGDNEELLGTALASMQDEVVITTKLHVRGGGGITRGDLSLQLRQRLEIADS
jgi:aryl-alcohol dehydrogenase-like predicted oxidoreductase